MLKQLNKAETISAEWPCLFCDEWGWDFWRIRERAPIAGQHRLVAAAVVRRHRRLPVRAIQRRAERVRQQEGLPERVLDAGAGA